MPLNSACLGVLGGHGRVRVGEECNAVDAVAVVVAVEPILRRTQMS